MSEKEIQKVMVDMSGYQVILKEGYQPKGEKVDPKILKPPKGGTAAYTPPPPDSKKE